MGYVEDAPLDLDISHGFPELTDVGDLRRTLGYLDVSDGTRVLLLDGDPVPEVDLDSALVLARVRSPDGDDLALAELDPLGVPHGVGQGRRVVPYEPEDDPLLLALAGDLLVVRGQHLGHEIHDEIGRPQLRELPLKTRLERRCVPSVLLADGPLGHRQTRSEE